MSMLDREDVIILGIVASILGAGVALGLWIRPSNEERRIIFEQSQQSIEPWAKKMGFAVEGRSCVVDGQGIDCSLTVKGSDGRVQVVKTYCYPEGCRLE
jgi:hypothetical protein